MEARALRYTNRNDPRRKYGFELSQDGHAVFFADGDDLVMLMEGAGDPAVEETVEDAIRDYEAEALLEEAEELVAGRKAVHYPGKPEGPVEIELLHRRRNGVHHVDAGEYLEELETLARELGRRSPAEEILFSL